MTVRATDFAFVDLGFDTFPTPAASCVDRYVGNFVSYVIKLKDNNVVFAAIDARVPTEVLDDPLPHLRPSLRHLPD